MKEQKKNDSGITLVALVVSIIVMLVLAGVSLNATVGENGIVTRAQEATKQHRIATELENLNLELAKMNVDTLSSDESAAIQEVVNHLASKSVIDGAVTTSAGQIAAGIDTTTGNKYFFVNKGENTYKITRSKDNLLSAELTQNASGGDITGGYALVTAENFNNSNDLPAEEKGRFTITSDAEVVFMDTISGALSIYVKSGVHATVGIYANMTLSNAGVRRSAIDIEPGGTLDMYIGDGVSVEVNSGLASDAGLGVEGQGGYAGIHVPKFDSDTEIKKIKLDSDGNVVRNAQMEPQYDTYIQSAGVATLNIMGSGTITAYGGNASAGAIPVANRWTSYWYNMEGAGGGGAGAGIGGNGGNGGSGIHDPHPGIDGGKGEDCGIVNIKGDVTIFAYGGGGADGGYQHGGSAPGGGGYPAAGIGGGGAGGGSATDCCCSGGYSSATSSATERIHNGLGAEAGGYYQGPTVTGYPEEISGVLGGVAGFGSGNGSASPYHGNPDNHNSGNGGEAGTGGTIKYVEGATIYAYNGNIYSDGTSYNSGENQAFIYAQSGSTPRVVKKLAPCNQLRIIEGYTTEYIEARNNVPTSGYKNPNFTGTTEMRTFNLSSTYSITKDMINQGIGSGAGNIETSNGTYQLCTLNASGVLERVSL